VINVSTIAAQQVAHAPATTTDVVEVRRRTIDTILTGAGALLTVVFLVAGALLMWGSNFADDYVTDELSSQNIFFPDQAALEEEGRTDLLKYADQQVTTGSDAEAYASYIDHHLDGIADGATYADLGAVERAANTEVEAAAAAGDDEAAVAELQAAADQVSAQRNSLFKGETLRGLPLSTRAWSTIGPIAAIAAFVAAGATIVLIVLGIVHRRRTPAVN